MSRTRENIKRIRLEEKYRSEEIRDEMTPPDMPSWYCVICGCDKKECECKKED